MKEPNLSPAQHQALNDYRQNCRSGWFESAPYQLCVESPVLSDLAVYEISSMHYPVFAVVVDRELDARGLDECMDLIDELIAPPTKSKGTWSSAGI
ncbi:hypothetical protein VNI00_006018 [Paramarasmius palmivorus]|uniref:Uncharacterized protein n=1 Tax=Paramarasmius palmivorus TaxID=297713 RepID=A0AAW0DEB8_9AGAR